MANVRALGGRGPVQRPRPPRGGGSGGSGSDLEDRRAVLPPMWALPELVEGAVRAGDAELARDALERLAETTQPCATDFALGIEARSRALLSDGSAAEGLYREAIDRLSRTRLRPELARAHLVFGEWLRREGRSTRRASGCGPPRRCSPRSGWRRSPSAPGASWSPPARSCASAALEPRDELTPQEEQIARLARDGLTNPEIGAQLFLSPRTVEWHLHKVFGKLGIDSRNGLRLALPSQEREGAAGRRLAFTHGRHPQAGVRGPDHRARCARWTAGEGPRGRERGPGHPRRSGHRQDRAAAIRRASGVRLPGCAAHGRRGGDGAAVRRGPSALRDDARPARRAPARRSATP